MTTLAKLQNFLASLTDEDIESIERDTLRALSARMVEMATENVMAAAQREGIPAERAKQDMARLEREIEQGMWRCPTN
jgi:hypothetical protein